MNGLFFRKTSLSLSIVRTSKNILEGVAYEKTTTTAERKSLYRESTEAKENPFKKAVKWIWCLVLFLCFSGAWHFFNP